MSKKFVVVFVVVLALVLAACAPVVTETPAAAPTEAPAAATEAPAASSGAPEVCASDPFGCAKVDPGTTVKVGMGAPMTGGDASFGIDISQGAQIAVKDAGQFEGFSFELVAQDDGGNAEGGAAVANKLVADPSVWPSLDTFSPVRQQLPCRSMKKPAFPCSHLLPPTQRSPKRVLQSSTGSRLPM
jgi:hypothetical protein